MDTLNYGGIDAVEMFDPEFDRLIKECKTDEERDKVIREYVSNRLLAVLIALVILFVVLLVAGVVFYLFK